MENNTTTVQKRYCWLNTDTGKFSNSWDEETQKQWLEGRNISEVQDAIKHGYRLIEYTCLNDSEFQFYHQMQLK